jgi:hypothetical protein
MTTADPLAAIAAMIGGAADEIPPAEIDAMASRLLERRGVAEGLVAGYFAEARRLLPDEATLVGFLALLTNGLGALRLEANGGARSAREALRAITALADREIVAAPLPSPHLLPLVTAFTQAQVDPGDALRQALAAAIERNAAEHAPELSERDGDAPFRQAVREVGDDPFALFASAMPTALALPPPHRLAMAVAMARSNVGAAREAAVGFLLDPDAAFAACVAERLVKEAPEKPVAAATMARLERIASWVPPERRPAVETLSAALTGKAEPRAAGPSTEILKVIGSAVDGSGMDTLFALVKTGRSRAVVSLLMRHGQGVIDAIVHGKVKKAEAEEMTDFLAAEGFLPVSGAYFERRLAAALAENVASAPPPFALLCAWETMALGPIAPRAAAPGEVLDGLLADLAPERTDALALDRAHKASAGWEARLGSQGVWFEAGEEVEELLAGHKTSKQRTAALLDELLPGRRALWAHRLAWTAAVLKEADPEDQMWVDMALVGRAVESGAPPSTIPLMVKVARASVEAFEAA